MAALASSQPLPASTNQMKPQNASASPINVMMPVCYIQLENGQLRDLRRLCGKKVTNLVPFRGVQRSISQPSPDGDNDNATSTATSKPQATPISTPSPIKPVTQPTASPSPSSIGRPASVQLPPGNPSTIVPSSPHPLTIREDRD